MYLDKSIEEINELLKKQEIKPIDLVEEAFERIEADKDLNAYITLNKEEALRQAKELETKEFTATAGGGAVEITVSGSREVLKVKLAEEVVDPDDIEMLEDLIVAATNEALRKVDEASASAMSKLTGGLGSMPGMPF